jgi:hypothetical protein
VLVERGEDLVHGPDLDEIACAEIQHAPSLKPMVVHCILA